MRTDGLGDRASGAVAAAGSRPGGRAWLVRVLLLLLLLVPAMLAPPAAAQPLASATRYLVLPFEHANRDARLLWLGEASAVLLTDALLDLKVAAITREDRVRALDRLRVPPSAALSHATVIRLGELVGATQVVVGSISGTEDALVVRARAMHLDTGRMSEDIVERGPLADLFVMHDRVASRLATDSPLTLDRPASGTAAAVFESYVKGLLAEAPATRVSFLTQALAGDPRFHRARLALWESYSDDGDHQRAFAIVRPVPADDRYGRQAQFRGALSMLRLGQYQGAYDVLTALAEARPDPAVLNNLGVIRLRRPIGGPGGRAVAYFQEALRLNPQSSDLLFNLGYAYWLDRDVPSAVAWLREAVRRTPADDAAHYVLGVALGRAGSTVEAAREKELARRLSSEYDAWEAKQGPEDQAPSGLERLITDIDTPAATRVEDAILSAGQRDQRELASFHLEAGRRAFQAGRDEEAIAELERTIYLAPYEGEAHLLLGWVHLRGRRLEDAIDAFTIAIWSRDTSAARVALAEAYLASDEPDAARTELQIVLAREPGHGDARRLLDRIGSR